MSAIWATLKNKALASITDALPHDQQVLDFFRLPAGEALVAESSAQFSLPQPNLPPETASGNVYLTTSYLCFRSSDRYSTVFIIPLFAIKRVVRSFRDQVSSTFGVILTTWHNMTMTIDFSGRRSQTEHFGDVFTQGLKAQQSNMKVLMPFLTGCYSEHMLGTGTKDNGAVPAIGLGSEFTFPGDPRKLKDRSKMRLWKDYMDKHGRNLTIVRLPLFSKLVRVGLPNALRGEVWEMTSGAMLSRWAHPGEFDRLQEANAGKNSVSLEEIEKDLNRSLPEFPAYQEDNKGIAALRRVLVSYSWRNPELGYCQAMNIVVAALLIYATEEQSFWLLDTLCSKMLPGYYSTTMYGTLLDQKVFEALVEKTMPILWSHFQKSDLQLSLVSLPWFLSLYINSMPLVLAFRVLDCFFLEGPSVLFQVGLGILKINGEALLAASDDGSFIEVLKSYFSTLEQSAYPESRDPRTATITNFQLLMVTAFKEFGSVTHDVVLSERRKYKNQTLDSIELFAKRTQLRSLNHTGRLSKDQLSNLYDRFHVSLYKQRVGFGGATLHNRMDYNSFRAFMAGIAQWAQEPESNHPFMHQLFARWDVEFRDSLSLQNVAQGLGELQTDESTPMEMISWFFETFDTNGHGKLSRNELLTLTETLLWLIRFRTEDETLRAISTFIHRCFEFSEQQPGDEILENELSTLTLSSSAEEHKYVSLGTFRMVVLADQALEDFFTGFPRTIDIRELKDKSTTATDKGLRGLLDAVMTDTQNLASEIRRNVKDFDQDIGNQPHASEAAEEENDRDLLQHHDLV